MKIELKSIKIADLINGYSNDTDTGVKGFGGKLDIRPPYQREFRYDIKQQQAVIDTILKGYPLNIMYWSVGEDGNYEMIDGQQRTLSICEFFTHGFNIEDKDRGTLFLNFNKRGKGEVSELQIDGIFLQRNGQGKAGLVQSYQHRRRKAA